MRATGSMTSEKGRASRLIPAAIATKVPFRIICDMGRACSPMLAIIVTMWVVGNAIKSTVKVSLPGRMALNLAGSGNRMSHKVEF